MSSISDQAYLLADQYRDASKLHARIHLHKRFSTNPYGWYRWVFDHLALPPKSRMLEVGCGSGSFWVENLPRLPEGWEITLSDFSSGMVQEARRNLCDTHQRFAFAVVDAQAIPFEEGSFDAVIASHMIYHVPDRGKALSEIHRVLRVGGRFYASTVGRAHLRELHDLVRRVAPDAESWGDYPPEAFLLENGREQLAQWFSGVALQRYEDALVMTEVAPVVAYVVSTTAQSVLVGDRLVEFVKLVERELAVHGAMYVTKDSGIFEACRDNDRSHADEDLAAVKDPIVSY